MHRLASPALCDAAVTYEGWAHETRVTGCDVTRGMTSVACAAGWCVVCEVRSRAWVTLRGVPALPRLGPSCDCRR